MKKLSSILVVALVAIFSLASTSPANKVFTSSQFVWCGLDFSAVKCIGAEGFNEPDQVKDRFFDSWNQLILNESEKYDVAKFYQKELDINALSVVNERNLLPKVEDLVIEDSYTFKEGQLQDIIQAYELAETKEGLGVVHVVESLNKKTELAAVHVVFFDIATKEILWTKKYYGAAAGFGFRNYWAKAYLNVMRLSGIDFRKAQKEYQKSDRKAEKQKQG